MPIAILSPSTYTYIRLSALEADAIFHRVYEVISRELNLASGAVTIAI